MKKVEEMDIRDIESYLKKVDTLKHISGRSYRIFWPFRILSPFSPSRTLLNIGVLVTWLYLISFLIYRPSIEMPARAVAVLWAVILILFMIAVLIERHVKIRFRYRALQLSQQRTFWSRTQNPESSSQHTQQSGQSTKSAETPQDAHSAQEAPPFSPLDLYAVGKDILRKLLK